MPIIKMRARKQNTNYTCGPAALRSIFLFYGVAVNEKELVDFGDIGENGTGFSTMRQLAHEYGFSFYAKHMGTLNDLKRLLDKQQPVLVCYQEGEPNGKNGHYAVIHGYDDTFLNIADPSNYFEGNHNPFADPRKVTIEKFMSHWWEIDNGQKIKRWYAIIQPRKQHK